MIYCEPKTDETLLGEIAGSKRVFLLGCSLCANVGYCLHNNLQAPIFQGLEVAVNVKAEARRLKRILAERGVQTASSTLIALCFLTKHDRQKIIRKTEGYDGVLTLCCDFGTQNVEGFLDGKRVVGAMTKKGFLRAVVDQKGLTFRFDRERLYINGKKYGASGTASHAGGSGPQPVA